MKRILFLFVYCSVLPSVFAVDIGSDIEVTRFANQVILADGDRIASFAALDAGFAFFDMQTSARFDSFFHVEGEMALNSGTLFLEQDLIFDEVSSWRSIGSITGNNHTLSLSPKMNCIPAVGSGTSCNLTSADTAAVAGFVTSSDWSFDNQYLNVLVFSPNNIETYQVTNNTLTNIASTTIAGGAPLILRWHPNMYFFAFCRTAVAGATPEIEIYEFDPSTNTLTLTSSLNTNITVFAIAWHPSGRYLAVLVNLGGTATVAIFEVDSNGIINPTLLDLLIVASGSAATSTRHAFEFDKSGKYIVVGVNNIVGLPDIYVLEFDETTETLSPNASLNVAGAINCLAATFNPGESNLIAASFDTPDNISLLDHNANAGTLTTIISAAQTQIVPTLEWSPNGLCLAVGRNTEFEVFSFDPQNTTFTSTFLAAVATRVETIQWSRNGTNVFQSTFATASPTLYAANAGTVTDSSTECVTFSDLRVFLNSDVLLKDCCITFTGKSVINGQGNCLSLSSTSSLVVDKNSDLLIKNIKIKSLSERRLVGTDSTSTFSFKNTELALTDDFIFDKGHFDVIGDLKISGNGHTFNYETDQVSTVSSYSNFILDTGVIFKYNPLGGANNLLHFTDRSAHLTIQNATLDVIDALSLSNGIIFIDGCSTFNITGTPAELTLGDGIDNQNSMYIHLSPAAKLGVMNGKLIHKNIS